MKILHRYITKTFIGPFVLVFAVVVFIFLMQFLWKYIDDLVGKDLDIFTILELLFYASVGLSSMAFPLAVLLASIMTLGSLGENYELIAMKASGISLQRIVKPLIVVSAIIGVTAFIFANYLTPYTNFKFRTLLYSIQQKRPELQIREGVFFDSIDNYSIRIGSRDYDTNMLYDIQIYDHTAGAGNMSVTIADSGMMNMTADKQFMEITLYDAESYNDVLDSRNRQQRTRPFRRDFYDVEIMRMALGDFSLQEIDNDLFKQGYQMMNIEQLTYVTDSLDKELSSSFNDLLVLVKSRYTLRPQSKQYRDTVMPDIMAYYPSLSKHDKVNLTQNAIELARYVKNDVATAVIITNSNVKDSRRYEIEYQRKFSLAFTCFIFFFIGAPLGAIIRKGGMGVSIVVAVMFFVLYYVINIIGEKSAREGLLTPAEGMWMASFVILSIGIFLTYQATRDASMMTSELYTNFFKKVLAYMFPVFVAPLPLPALDRNKSVTYDSTCKSLEVFNELALSFLAKMRKWPLYSDIWIVRRKHKWSEDTESLTILGEHYVSMQAMLKQLDFDMKSLKYTEYPVISFVFPKLPVSFWGQSVLYFILFPIGAYYYFRYKIAQWRFKQQLLEVTRVNHIVKQVLEEIGDERKSA